MPGNSTTASRLDTARPYSRRPESPGRARSRKRGPSLEAGRALLEHEAQDDADHQEARKRVGHDADPDGSEPFGGIRLTEEPGQQVVGMTPARAGDRR